MALFQQLVLAVEKGNIMKRQLNAYHQQQRVDPDELEPVSDDKLEDAMPDIMEFLSLPSHSSNDGIAAPTLPIPNLEPAESQLPPYLPMHGLGDVNWVDVLANPPSSLAGLNLLGQTSALLKLSMDWNIIGPSFLDADAKKNEHELNPTGIPDTPRMMMHLKLFIPFPMLTTALLSWICYNDNLNYKKISLGYAAGKYTLDEAHFPLEE